MNDTKINETRTKYIYTSESAFDSNFLLSFARLTFPIFQTVHQFIDYIFGSWTHEYSLQSVRWANIYPDIVSIIYGKIALIRFVIQM